MSDLRELAREKPNAVRSVAEKKDDELCEWLLRVVKEESPDWYEENVNNRSGGLQWE